MMLIDAPIEDMINNTINGEIKGFNILFDHFDELEAIICFLSKSEFRQHINSHNFFYWTSYVENKECLKKHEHLCVVKNIQLEKIYSIRIEKHRNNICIWFGYAESRVSIVFPYTNIYTVELI